MQLSVRLTPGKLDDLDPFEEGFPTETAGDTTSRDGRPTENMKEQSAGIIHNKEEEIGDTKQDPVDTCRISRAGFGKGLRQRLAAMSATSDTGRFSVQQISRFLETRLSREMENQKRSVNGAASIDDEKANQHVSLDLTGLKLKNSALDPSAVREACTVSSTLAENDTVDTKGLSTARLFVAALHLAHHHNHNQQKQLQEYHLEAEQSNLDTDSSPSVQHGTLRLCTVAADPEDGSQNVEILAESVLLVHDEME